VVSYFEGRRKLYAFENEVLKDMFRPQGTVLLIQHYRVTAAATKAIRSGDTKAIRRGDTAAAA
jgi:hypothetical protein